MARTPELREVLNYLSLSLEEVKDKLVTCEPAMFPVLQGEARALDALVRAISRPSAITQPTTQE